jgi:hypothetical protein
MEEEIWIIKRFKLRLKTTEKIISTYGQSACLSTVFQTKNVKWILEDQVHYHLHPQHSKSSCHCIIVLSEAEANK